MMFQAANFTPDSNPTGFYPADLNSLPTLNPAPRQTLSLSAARDFLVTVKRKAQSPSSEDAFEQVEISSGRRVPDAAWHEVENPAYKLMLDGHLYLEGLNTMAVLPNLNRLLQKISMSTINKGLTLIAGGIFNLLILDKQMRRLIITGDRFGYMPLYYQETEDDVQFCGNQFVLQSQNSLFDWSIAEFLKYGYLPFSPSLFTNVKRRLPGQVLSVSLDDNALTVSNPQVFEFKPLSHRIQHLPEAAAALHDVFQRYFSRLSGNTLLEIGGDSCSRMLAALSQPIIPKLLHLKNELPYERIIAKKLAIACGNSLKVLPENGDMLLEVENRLAGCSRNIHSADFRRGRRLAHFCASLAPGSASYFLERFTGEALLNGDLYRYDAPGVGGTPKISPAIPAYDGAIRDIQFYQNYLYHRSGALADELLGGILRADTESWFLNATRGILEVNRNAGQIHEDFMESLSCYTEVRCLAAVSPIMLSAYLPCLSPFFDYQVMQVCFDSAKSLRAQGRLMSHYCRQYFPAVTAIKEPRRSRSARRSRLLKTYLGNLVGKKELAGRLTANVPRRLVSSVLAESHADIPNFVKDAIDGLSTEDNLDRRLFERFVTLNTYLG